MSSSAFEIQSLASYPAVWETVYVTSDVRKASARAKEHSDAARQSSDQHSHDLAKMRQVADDAADNLKTARNKRRKREDFGQAAARNGEKNE